MVDFSLHPNVYATGTSKGLIHMLEDVWVRTMTPGDGTLYIVSGFGNYNGGVRFYDVFKRHIDSGGRIVSFFGGSTSQRLTSKQLVQQLLGVGAEVNLVNRKRILHAKLYGAASQTRDALIVTSGNFTGPGMSLNVEASVSLPGPVVAEMGFSWTSVIQNLRAQSWDLYQPALADPTAPAWRLLYDEYAQDLTLDESEKATLLLTLSHADTARIQAVPGTSAGKGTQYFWLSKDSYGFFPPLTIRNTVGQKATFSCLIRLRYVDLGIVDENTRVTFEAENNFDFRLGTGKLRYTRLAAADDIAALTRIGESDYELRLFRRGTAAYVRLLPHLVTYIGHQGKRYGYVENDEFRALIGDAIYLPQ